MASWMRARAHVGAFAEVVLRDFLERQEAVAVFAVVDEAGLERRLDARDDGLVDVALALFAAFDLGLEVEQLLAVDDRQAPLFGLRRVDQHAFHSAPFSRRCLAMAGGGTASTGRVPCGARPIDARETRRNPGSNRPGLRGCGPDGPSALGSVGACVSAQCCVSCGVDPGRCIVAAAMRRHGLRRRGAASNGQAWERVTVDNMRRGVAGRGCKAGLRTVLHRGIFRVPLKAGFLLRVSVPPASGRRVTWGPRPTCGRTGVASPAHAPPRGPCGLTFDPASAPGKLRQIKHLRHNRGPAHYRGQRSIGCSRCLAGAGRPPRRP